MLLLAPLLLVFVAKPQTAVAQDILAEPECVSDIGHSICQSDALRAAFRNAVGALRAESHFYFGDTQLGREFLQSELAKWQRNWSENCRMEGDVSSLKRSCLLDNLWAASVDARCPLIISLFGVPSADRQRAWFKENEAFCRGEIEPLYQSGG